MSDRAGSDSLSCSTPYRNTATNSKWSGRLLNIHNRPGIQASVATGAALPWFGLDKPAFNQHHGSYHVGAHVAIRFAFHFFNRYVFRIHFSSLTSHQTHGKVQEVSNSDVTIFRPIWNKLSIGLYLIETSSI